MLDALVKKIADDAARGEAPSQNDIAYLLDFDERSPEASYVCAKARALGMCACKGRGYIYAQIGVDETACPANCKFCSFAAINTDVGQYDSTRAVVPLERIVHYSQLFDNEGVDAISLMATAALDFDQYIEMVHAVHSAVSSGAMIMVNAGDISFEQACALREAGARAAYHALRLGEGELTDIAPAVRRRTISNIRESGLMLMTGVEPVWKGIDSHALSERICEIPAFTPFAIGACALTDIGDSATHDKHAASRDLVKYVAAITRLTCGDAVPIGGIGGVAWVDAGCDPRNRGYGEDDAMLCRKIAAARNRLAQDGFVIG